jgi:hypothetical protein
MRFPRRLLLSIYSIFFFVFSVVRIQVAQAQSPASHPSQLPPAWNDVVNALAEKIAATTGPSRTVWLEVKNISSLNVAEANAIQQELQGELRRRHLNFASTTQSEMFVDITLSEGVASYIWSAQVHKGDSTQTYVFGIPRQTPRADSRLHGSITLNAQLIWTQAEKFLDFAFPKPGDSRILVILGLNQVESYEMSASTWHLQRSTPVSQTTPVRRDVAGGFDPEGWDALMFDASCLGTSGEPEKLQCSEWYSFMPTKTVPLKVPRHEDSARAILNVKCGVNTILIVSGTGDWTQADTLQGFLLAGPEQQAVPSGSPIPFDGPVLNVRPDWKESTVRAIVHNVKTGNYEGYLVTATCSH